MSAFDLYTYGILTIAIAGFAWSLLKLRDVFHPFAYLMPMVAYLYVYLPYELVHQNILTEEVFDSAAHVQLINGSCIAALVAGIFLGSHRPKKPRKQDAQFSTERLYVVALVFGAAALLSFVVTLGGAGGLYEAYSNVKGGGTAESGYVRDVVFLSVPAVAAIGLCMAKDGLRLRYVLTGLVFAAPMLVHGLLGGRRGPTFIGIATLSAAYYMSRRTRPSVPVFLGGGAAVGLLLLLIVSFREQFRIGSDLFTQPITTLGSMMDELQERRSDTLDRVMAGDEFLYGASVISRFEYDRNFFWGKRLATIAFIRPIPRQWWPTKYEDVGMERYLVNVGLGGVEAGNTVVYGAAPGFAADLFAEFWWGAVAASILIGFGYGRAWRNSVDRGGLGFIVYILLMAFSIFFVLQTMEAVVYRFLLTAIPISVAWRLFVRPKFPMQQNSSRVLQPVHSI
jgi:hypothetical protein